MDRPLGGASLDALLTGDRWKDRELGGSRTVDLPARVVWAATGNNLRYRSDIARRVLLVRLDSQLELPRRTFRLQKAQPNRLGAIASIRIGIRSTHIDPCVLRGGMPSTVRWDIWKFSELV